MTPGTPSHDGGLVICAKSVRARPEGAAADGHWRAGDALGLRFPGADLVSAAAATFDSVDRLAGYQALALRGDPGRYLPSRACRETELEGRGSFQISTGPGVVRLGWKRPVRQEKAAERAARKRATDLHAMEFAIEQGLETEPGLKWPATVAVANAPPSASTGRAVTSWSRKSRTAMCRTFAELDYRPMVASGRVPAMVTLTYPGEWLTVAPDGRSVKRHMVLLRKRFHRNWGEPMRYIWKMEFQRRGAPHVHLWMAPPVGVGRSGVSFRAWLSDTWADIVAHPDPVQRNAHRVAGTAVDVLSGLRAVDPKRLAIYFTKHSSPNTLSDKEYQHEVPNEWQAPGKGPGRFWGYHGLVKAVATVEVDLRDYVAAKRIIRRWSRAQVSYGSPEDRFPTSVAPRTVYRRVQRVHRNTGRVYYRWVRRRQLLCDQGSLNGGFALVNDGPAFASQVARGVRVWKPSAGVAYPKSRWTDPVKWPPDQQPGPGHQD
jgi:hypothetical protein